MAQSFTTSSSPLGSHQSAQRREDEYARIMGMRRREAESREARERESLAIVEKIKQARADVDAAVQKLQQTSMELKAYARRNPDESGSSLMVFANAHLRVCGACSQGVRRTASMDRVLNRAAQEQELARRREAEDEKRAEERAHRRKVKKLSLPVPDPDAFAEVYGELLDA